MIQKQKRHSVKVALFLCRRWSGHYSLENNQLTVDNSAQVSDGSNVFALPVIVPVQVVFTGGHFGVVRPKVIQANGWVLADVALDNGSLVTPRIKRRHSLPVVLCFNKNATVPSGVWSGDVNVSDKPTVASESSFCQCVFHGDYNSGGRSGSLR